jgi:hypothetical protein
MITRQTLLAIAMGVALPTSSFVLGACGSTTVQTPPATVNVNQPPPQPQPMAQPQVVGVAPVAVNAAWVPGGVYDDVANHMALRARQFALGFAPASDLIRATIRQGNEGVMVPGTVQAGYCYRIIAVGGAGVRDLDLMLYDPTGRQVDADRAPDNYPVIGLNRPLCIPPGVPPQTAQLRIRAFTGSGAIGVQMFAQPFNGAMPMAQPVMAAPMVGTPGVVYR